MIGCNNCKEFCRVIQIDSPSKLTKRIKTYVKEGKLQDSDYWPANALHSQPAPIRYLNEEKPWDDFVEYYIECKNCHQVFGLIVETYHGSGGQLKPIKTNGA